MLFLRVPTSPLPVARSSPSAPLPTPACPLPHPRDVHSLKPGDRVHSQFYRCPDRADARSFRTFASPHPPFPPSSFPIDGPPSNAVPRVPISPLTVSTSLFAVTRFHSLWLVLAFVARRPDSANQPRLSVGVEGKCQGEGVDSAIGSDTNRYEAIEIASLFLGPICVSYAAYRFASISPFRCIGFARKIQLLDIRTRRSGFNLLEIWQVESVTHSVVLRGRVET